MGSRVLTGNGNADSRFGDSPPSRRKNPQRVPRRLTGVCASSRSFVGTVVAVTTSMGITRAIVHGVAVCAAMLPLPFMAEGAGIRAAYLMTVERGGRTVQATATLIRSEVNGQGALLHFVAPAHLFRNGSDVRVRADAITLQLDGGRRIEIDPADVTLPPGGAINIAVIAARVAGGAFPPAPPLVFLAPRALQSIEIETAAVDGSAARTDARIVHVATVAAFTDRPLASPACEGSAALRDGAVFGFVSRCPPGARATIVPLAAVARWLERQLPGGTASTLTSLGPGRMVLDAAGPPHLPPLSCPPMPPLAGVTLDVVARRRA